MNFKKIARFARLAFTLFKSKCKNKRHRATVSASSEYIQIVILKKIALDETETTSISDIQTQTFHPGSKVIPIATSRAP